MKYFKKNFDGPQNIYLCLIFEILFFKLRELEHKISSSHPGDLKKTILVK